MIWLEVKTSTENFDNKCFIHTQMQGLRIDALDVDAVTN